jgi:hypothetical protein
MTGVGHLGGDGIQWPGCFQSPRGLASFGFGGYSCFTSFIESRQLVFRVPSCVASFRIGCLFIERARLC